jgi:tetratricopeptide (TPR) repeat protein
VRGPAGAGKSALLANWLAERGREWAGRPVFVHSAGSTPTSSRWESLLTRFMTWAGGTLGIQETIPDEGEPDELLIAFQRALRAAAKSRPLLLLDGASELQGPEGFTSLCWLPEEVPEDVRIILTARDESAALAEIRRRGWPELAVGPLTLEERQGLVQSALERAGRRLSGDDLRQIAQAPMTETPLYTRILIQELCTVGRHEELSEQIQTYLEAESLGSLYAKLFRRWEADYGAEVVRRTLVLTSVSRDGLLEQDLLGMTVPEGNPLTSSRLSPFLYSAELEISPRPGNLALTNTYVAEAIEKAYLTPEVVDVARAALISYYQKPIKTEIGFTLAIGNEKLRKQIASAIADTEGLLNELHGRAFHELPWQLYNAGRWEELRELVGQGRYLKWAMKSRPRDPARWWRELTPRGYRAADAFADELDPAGDASPEELERIVLLLTETGETEAAFHGREVLNAKYQAANAWRPLGWSKLRQAALLVAQEEFDLALERYREAESAFLKGNDGVGAACAKADLGIALFKRGTARWQVKDIRESSRVLNDSLRALQKEGMTSLLGTVYNALGVIDSARGKFDTARDYLKRAEHLFRSIGQRPQVAEVFQNRGILEATARRREAAAEAFREAARLYHELGDDMKAVKVEHAAKKVMERRSLFRQDFLRMFFKNGTYTKK